MIGYLISALVGLIGYGLYQTIRSQGLSALLQNFDLKNKLNTIDTQVAKNNGIDQAEVQKRDAIQDALDGKIKETNNETLNELKDFLNNSTHNDPK